MLKYFYTIKYLPLFLGGMVKAGVKRSEGLAP
ncbi:stage V sporulation protein M [Bacillus thuringiensis]